MNIFIASIVGLLSGLSASLGLGGGMVLLIYLTTFVSVPQLEAQGINLLFFLPIAAISLIIHLKSRLIDFRVILPSLVSGVISAALVAFMVKFIDVGLLRKAFGVMIILIGIREVFFSKKKKSPGTKIR